MMDYDAPEIVESLPKAPLPLDFLLELEDTESINEAAALIVGGNRQGDEYMLQFILQTDTNTFVLTLPAQEDDPDRWHVLCKLDGADDDTWSEAVLEAKLWREERGLPAEHDPRDE